jgi:hypothetical protein
MAPVVLPIVNDYRRRAAASLRSVKRGRTFLEFEYQRSRVRRIP